MSWEEEVVQAFLTEACKVCINLPACLYDLDVHKAWLFASTLEALASMGGICNHPQGFHKSIVGTRDEHGNFQSKLTAQYPKAENICNDSWTTDLWAQWCTDASGRHALPTA